MGALTIYMCYVIRLCILHYAFPDYVLCWKVCYIYFLLSNDSSAAPELFLHFIDMFVYHITVSTFIFLLML